MRQALIDWQRATKSLLMITENVTEDQRDEVISKINQLLDVREALQPKIKAPFTKEEEAYGQSLMQLEADLQKRLAVFMKDIRQDITVTQSKKTHMKNYVNPYGNMTQDGAYYDTKQ